MKRGLATVVAALVVGVLLTGCGEDGNWITPNVHTVTLPNGSKVVCVTAGDSSYAGIDCDWDSVTKP